MSGQTAVAMLHPTDAGSSRKEGNAQPPPPRSDSPKERCKPEYAVAKQDVGGESLIYSFPPKRLGKSSGENITKNSKEHSSNSLAAPDQASSLRQEVGAHDRHGAKESNNARLTHPQSAKVNAVDKYDPTATKVSQPRDTSKYVLPDPTDASEIPSKMASDAKTPADGTSPTSDQSSTDGPSRKTPSSPSSPSKKKKNKKKKKVSLLQFSSLTMYSLSHITLK